MEEILASIRRIISDDEAKPAATAEPARAEPAKPAVAKTEPPRAAPPASDQKLAPARTAAALSSVKRPPAPPSAPVEKTAAVQVEKNSQAEIDAMMASFDTPAPNPPAATADIDETESDVFELTEQMAMSELPPVAFQKIEADDDLEFAESAPPTPTRPALIDPPTIERAVHGALAEAPGMLSTATVSSVETAFNALASTVLSNNARTLEDLVKDMLRPMLKSWLDDNLPGLVERIVKSEIERVSRGR